MSIRIQLNSPAIGRFLASDEAATLLEQGAQKVEAALPAAIADTDASFAGNPRRGRFYSGNEDREIFNERDDSTEPRAARKVGLRKAQNADFRAGTIQKAMQAARRS